MYSIICESETFDVQNTGHEIEFSSGIDSYQASHMRREQISQNFPSSEKSEAKYKLRCYAWGENLSWQLILKGR